MTASETDTPQGGLSYRQAGVDIAAGNALVEAIKPHARSTARPGAQGELGGFGGLFDLKAAGFTDPVLVAANDGVGTKVKLAFTTGRHDTVGIDLVAMCVNDLIVQGAEPLFFLDYFATGALEGGTAERVVAGIAEGCRQAGAALIGGETAEMPGMYAPGEYDLAGFAVGAAERGTLLPRGDIEAGDVVLAIASSGVHSNGYSLVRRIVSATGAALDAPAPFAAQGSLADILLAPTQIYVRPILSALRSGLGIKALAHITGGGITENLPRVLPENVAAKIDLHTLRPHPVFGWLAEAGSIAQEEMLTTFNCGVGMICVVSAADADQAAAALGSAGDTVWQLGAMVARTGAAVVYDGEIDWRG